MRERLVDKVIAVGSSVFGLGLAAVSGYNAAAVQQADATLDVLVNQGMMVTPELRVDSAVEFGFSAVGVLFGLYLAVHGIKSYPSQHPAQAREMPAAIPPQGYPESSPTAEAASAETPEYYRQD
jgi:hypothetical protein